MTHNPAPPAGIRSRWEEVLRTHPAITGLPEARFRQLLECSLEDLRARTRASLTARFTETERLRYLAVCALPGGTEAGQAWAELHLPGRDLILQEAAAAVLAEIRDSPRRYLAHHNRHHLHPAAPAPN
jgi:hypothetical protein